MGVEPAPQGSKRYVGNGRFIEASKKVAPFREAVAHAVHSEWVRSGDERSFEQPVIVYATFFLPKPSTVKRLLPTVMPDLDKLCRALGDGMSVNSKAVVDDSLIVRWVATKLYADEVNPVGCQVRIVSADFDTLKKDSTNT